MKRELKYLSSKIERFDRIIEELKKGNSKEAELKKLVNERYLLKSILLKITPEK